MGKTKPQISVFGKLRHLPGADCNRHWIPEADWFLRASRCRPRAFGGQQISQWKPHVLVFIYHHNEFESNIPSFNVRHLNLVSGLVILKQLMRMNIVQGT